MALSQTLAGQTTLTQATRFLNQVEEARRRRASFFLSAGFFAVMPKRSVGLGNELGAAALDEIAAFGDDVL